MRILTYITTEEDAGRAARSVVPRRFQLGTHAFRRLKVEGGILCDGAPLHADTVLRAGPRLEIRMDTLPYEHIRWIENENIDMDKLVGTSDMKKIQDLKGRPLLLFVNAWSVGMVLDRNEGLVLSEFGRE